MDYYHIVRQPIFQKKRQLHAYELILRRTPLGAPEPSDADIADGEMVREPGPFQLKTIADLTAGKHGMVTFDAESLLAMAPLALPKKHLIMALASDLQPSTDVINAIIKIKNRGYSLAIDLPTDPAWEPIYPLINIVKVNHRATAPETLQAVKEALERFDVRYMATHLDTYNDFSEAREQEYDYFQGQFFARPQAQRTVKLSEEQALLVTLISECNKPAADLKLMSDIIETDQDMTDRLLKYVNSPAFLRGNPIETLPQALVYLGEDEVKRFATVIATGQLSPSKPAELIRLAIARARFCELLAREQALVDPARAFVVGLFSLLDAVMDDKLEALLERLLLNTDVRTALIQHKGLLAGYLAVIRMLERADWTRLFTAVSRLKLEDKTINGLYREAIHWANAYDPDK
ncbi:MAG: HDOD domain-containing protein [Natronospirillum sp.]